MIDTLLFAVVVIVLAAALILGVVPKLRRAESDSLAHRHWVDLWFPITLAAPLALIAFGGGGAWEPPAGVWLVVGPTLGIAGMGLGLSMLWPRRAAGESIGLDRQHGFALTLLGWVLLLAAAANRLNLWHGQILITLALLWAWMRSADRPEKVNVQSGQDAAPRQPVFVFDWAGPLPDPVPASVKGLILLALAAAGFLAIGRAPDPRMAVWTIAGSQAAVILMVGIAVGAASLQRLTASLMAFNILLGLGAAALGLARTASYTSSEGLWMFGPSQLIGMASLRASAVLVLGLGLLALIVGGGRRVRSITAGLVVVTLAVVVLTTGSDAILNSAASLLVDVLSSLRVLPPASA